MGTRADFYVKSGDGLEWLGSIAWDGYDVSPADECTDEQDFRAKVAETIADSERGGTAPELGWPWPWEDSTSTDRQYVFDQDKVVSCAWGRLIVDGDEEAEDEGPAPPWSWPNMTERQGLEAARSS